MDIGKTVRRTLGGLALIAFTGCAKTCDGIEASGAIFGSTKLRT